MAGAMRLLVLNDKSQSLPFHIGADHFAQALSRSERAPPPVDVDIMMTDDPALADAIAAADVIVAARMPCAQIAARATRLKLVQTTTAGSNHLQPLDWLPAGAVLVSSTGVQEGPKFMEWAMMVFLMLHTAMPHYVTAQRQRCWSVRTTGSVVGKTALIYGTGAIGRTIAAGAERLGIIPIGVRRSAGEGAPGFARTIGLAEAADLMAQADFVVLAFPLTAETAGMMDRQAFQHMRPGAHFANFGRGGLVDEDALVDALESGQLGGAVIDVTHPEPPEPDSRLWDAPRLMVTPHTSADDPDRHVSRVLDILVENLRRLADGEPLINVVPPGDRL